MSMQPPRAKFWFWQGKWPKLASALRKVLANLLFDVLLSSLHVTCHSEHLCRNWEKYISCSKLTMPGQPPPKQKKKKKRKKNDFGLLSLLGEVQVHESGKSKWPLPLSKLAAFSYRYRRRHLSLVHPFLRPQKSNQFAKSFDRNWSAPGMKRRCNTPVRNVKKLAYNSNLYKNTHCRNQNE